MRGRGENLGVCRVDSRNDSTILGWGWQDMRNNREGGWRIWGSDYGGSFAGGMIS